MNASKTNQITAEEFAAQCLELIDEVQATGTPIVITRDEMPIAQLIPAPPSPFGFMAGTFKILGDIVTSDPSEWEDEFSTDPLDQ